ncbi:LysR family transcriptional regulator [Heliorestis acidaminivorans]|uniref:LysR family transcriptional regulator n=1 Tax=Heliorestis acidaminivorans TaxID=553427 RepID=A0A6I0F326_9FIRM|nr:LysR family transcriptional regulator [Heliorestis acidaminivorans]KAB2951524.1 LysR family transcriptional regulator [Heliorestis acidaminivorans]
MAPLNLNHLRIFYAVAKAQSFSKAAEELFVSQPSLSVQIKRFEQDLEVKLFHQVGRQIVLTDIGEKVFLYAQKVFSVVDELEHHLQAYKGLNQGRLVVGASTTPGTYMLPKILGQFKRNFPAIEVTLEIGNSKEIEEKILNHQLEVAFVGEDVIEERLHIVQVPELMISRSINVIYLKDVALSVPAVALLDKKCPPQ